MKVKFNKDLLIKQRFWILLGLVVPFTAFCLLTLSTTVASQIANQRKEIQTKAKSVEKTPSPEELKNQIMIDEIAVEAQKLQKKEGEVWQLAYKAQNDIFRWPADMEKKFEFTSGMFGWDIKVDLTKKDVAEMPPDDPQKNLLHGKVTKVTKDFLLMNDRNGKEHKIRDTGRKVSIGDAKNEVFQRIATNHLVAVTYEKGKYFGDPLTVSEQNFYADAERGVYKSQLHSILAQVKPMNAKGKGVVQLRGWAYDEDKDPNSSRIFTYFKGPWKITQDLSEEAWIAQEDLWIQEEIYRLIRQANDYVSIFKGTGGAKKNEAYTFTNPYWQLILKWPGENKLQVTVKNLLHRRQKLDFDFLVRMTENTNIPPERIRIPGAPLYPVGSSGKIAPARKKDEKAEDKQDDESDTRTVELTLDAAVKRSGIFSVEQDLTWETAAVRRVDNVCFGKMPDKNDNSLSNRNYPDPMKPYKEEKKDDKAGTTKAPGAGGGGVELPGGPGPGGGGTNETPNGFVRERYLEVTPQLRRLPVSVCLIVEQEHVDRVQLSFNNSRLRFLTTQVLLNRYPGSVRPQVTETAETTEPKSGGGDKKDPRGGGEKVPGPGPGNTGSSGSSSAAADELETNVEVVIYGIITLYEKFPARVFNPDAKQ